MTKSAYLVKAEYQRKLAVWAKRKRLPGMQALHEDNAKYFYAMAEEASK
jgi:hypothetical protein